MPKLNHSGPMGEGPKTGRILGKCHKTETDIEQQGALGAGMAKRRNSGGGEGKGKRIKYYKTLNNTLNEHNHENSSPGNCRPAD
jgi:hypothetical protein